VLLVIAAFLKFGKLVSFIPAPVITGFTSGIAIIIAIGQIDNFLGIKTPQASSSALKLIGYFTNKFEVDEKALLFGAVVILIMVLCPKKISSKIPSSLIGIIFATGLNFFLKFNVAVIGEIPASLFPKTRLMLPDITLNSLNNLINIVYTTSPLSLNTLLFILYRA
jgi:SulP family sulfate permease